MLLLIKTWQNGISRLDDHFCFQDLQLDFQELLLKLSRGRLICERPFEDRAIEAARNETLA